MDRTHKQLSLRARRRIVEFTLPEMTDHRSADRVAALLRQTVGTKAVVTDALRHKVRVAFDPPARWSRSSSCPRRRASSASPVPWA